MHIVKYLQWDQGEIKINGQPYAQLPYEDSQELLAQVYQRLQPAYPKFFKMDILSKLAFLALELLRPDFESVNKDRTAVVLSTHQGCIDVDTKFDASRQTIASPALFVYTLPNIMLGEICIRHQLKGAQICFIEETANPDLLYFHTSDLLTNRNSEGCICGHIEARENYLEAIMAWITPKGDSEGSFIFNSENLRSIFI